MFVELLFLLSSGRLPKYSRRDGGIHHSGASRPPTRARVWQKNAQRSLMPSEDFSYKTLASGQEKNGHYPEFTFTPRARRRPIAAKLVTPYNAPPMVKQKKRPLGATAQNEKASYDYSIEQCFEMGIALAGWGIKGLHVGKT